MVFSEIRFTELGELPPGAALRSVDATNDESTGRSALRVRLDDAAAAGEPGVDYIDQPTFVVLPVEFLDGRIDVSLRATTLADAPDYSRGFAGLAYRIAPDASHFESVYLRPLNGRSLNPPAPRGDRAVQYFSFPEWPYDRLREVFPDGPFEGGADILPNSWMTLSLEVDGRAVRASVDGVEVLRVDDTMTEPTTGAVGLWVDIGTDALFADLIIDPR